MRGLGSTAWVISSAAAIMIAVFLGFATDPNVMVKTIEFGMAAAVFIDATLIRLVLAPAAMVLLGRVGWWLPGPLARRSVPAAAPEPSAVPADAAAGELTASP